MFLRNQFIYTSGHSMVYFSTETHLTPKHRRHDSEVNKLNLRIAEGSLQMEISAAQ